MFIIITRAGVLSISIFVRVDIKTKNSINKVTITNLDKEVLPKLGTIFIGENCGVLLAYGISSFTSSH
tara:strand:- start:846 stop:1049 length:204 start_codon:yes stop_codon:yes gene_type:complete